MKWYLAKLVYQIVIEGHPQRGQFDEQLRLIQADELGWALEKANVVAQLGIMDFANHRNEKVEWKFIAVVDIWEIEKLEDGIEICSSTHQPEHVSQYLDEVHARAERLSAFFDQPARSEVG